MEGVQIAGRTVHGCAASEASWDSGSQGSDSCPGLWGRVKDRGSLRTQKLCAGSKRMALICLRTIDASRIDLWGCPWLVVQWLRLYIPSAKE